jgi:WhiB family redox-sensing transcriptional regulator
MSAGPLFELMYPGESADGVAWQESALCAQTDPELFFPEKGGSVREAKKVCMACPVRAECLEWALDTGERYGIWGGLSERERRKVKKQRDAAKQAPAEPEPAAEPGEQAA